MFFLKNESFCRARELERKVILKEGLNFFSHCMNITLS